MQTFIRVCNMELFDKQSPSFWSSTLDQLTKGYFELRETHIQEFYSILAIDQAEGELIIDNETFQLENNQVFIIKPGCIVKHNIKKGSSGQFIVFTESFFSLRYHDNVLSRFSFLQDNYTLLSIQEEENDKWKTILHLLIDEFCNREKELNKVLRSYLNILFHQLERIVMPLSKQQVYSPNSTRYKTFEALVNVHFVRYKMPNEYADLMHLSPSYLNKICKAESGKTSGEIIRERVLLEAKRMLHHTYNQVSEIAYALGFENVPYFVTFFKRGVGTTPENFRKKAFKNEQ